MELNRRNVLIGLGGIAAGGGALAGTGAFSSVQATRSADVNVAGDASAFLGIDKVDGANSQYVSQSGNSYEINLDGDAGLLGSGVNDQAVTQFDELLLLRNQGTQPVHVYTQDASDAVTFHSGGNEIEGPEDSVELEVGEEIVVGLTVDTTGDQSGQSGQILDEVTIYAVSDDPNAGVAAGAQYNIVVSNAANDPDADYSSIPAAIDAASPGDTIAVKTTGTSYSIPSSGVAIGTGLDGLTITGMGGVPLVTSPKSGGNTIGRGVIQVRADDVTLRNLELDYTDDVGIYVRRKDAGKPSGFTAEGLVVSKDDTGNFGSTISITGDDSTLQSNTLNNGPLAVRTGGATIIGNSVDNVPTEGIFAYREIDSAAFLIRNNTVTNYDTDGSGARQILIGIQGNTPQEVNGATDLDGQFRALLTENNVNTVNIGKVGDGTGDGGYGGGGGYIVDPAASASNVFSAITAAADAAGTNGYVMVDEGPYTQFSVDEVGLTVEAAEGVRPTVAASGSVNRNRILELRGADSRVAGFEVVGKGPGTENLVGIYANDSGTAIEDNLVRDALTGVQTANSTTGCVVRHCTVTNSNVGASTQGHLDQSGNPDAGGPGHVVEKCDFTGLVGSSPYPEGHGVGDANVESRDNNYGEDVFLRVYDDLFPDASVTSDGDFFGANGEDGEVISRDSDPSNLTVRNVSQTKNPDAGIR